MPEYPDPEDLCQLIFDLCEEIEGSECADKAQVFVDGVRDRAESMRAQYQDRGSLTDKQVQALRNMAAGLKGWLS